MKIEEKYILIESEDQTSASFMANIRKKYDLPIFYWFEIDEHKLAVDSIITSRDHKTSKIPARKCKIIELPYRATAEFLDKYHLFGHDSSEIRIGLQYHDDLVAVMTFTKRTITQDKPRMELVRFATKSDVTVVGGASKMLRYFEEVYHPTELVTFSDLRFSNGDFYNKLGFCFSHKSKSSYRYISPDNSVHSRVSFQKYKLSTILEQFDDNKSEWENMRDNGYKRIFDCGNMVFKKNYNWDSVWSVYLHIFPNDKKYVGISAIAPAVRWRNGFGYNGQVVYSAIRKYGWINIEHRILTTCNTEAEAEHLEVAYIKEFDTTNEEKGYNRTVGGNDMGKYCIEGLINHNNTPEKRKLHNKKISEALRNSKKFHDAKKDAVERMKSNPEWQNKHREFLTVLHASPSYIKNHREAMKKMWDDPEHKKRLINGIRAGMTAGTKRRTPVVCVTTGKSYFCIADAIADMPESKLSCGAIVKCCRGELNYSGSLPDGTRLKWRFENQEAHEDKPFDLEYLNEKEWMKRHGMRKFICVETGEIYTSINKVVVSVLKMKSHNRTKLKECLDGKREEFAGFHWKYLD